MLRTRAPLYSGLLPFSLDLHVLSVPLTFALSQDQTLQLNLQRRSIRRLLSRSAAAFDNFRDCCLLGITIVGVFEVPRPKAKRITYLFELSLLFSFQRPTRTVRAG